MRYLVLIGLLLSGPALAWDPVYPAAGEQLAFTSRPCKAPEVAQYLVGVLEDFKEAVLTLDDGTKRALCWTPVGDDYFVVNRKGGTFLIDGRLVKKPKQV